MNRDKIIHSIIRLGFEKGELYLYEELELMCDEWLNKEFMILNGSYYKR